MLSCWEVSNIGARKLENRVRELLKKHARVEKWNEVCELKDEDWILIEVIISGIHRLFFFFFWGSRCLEVICVI